MTTDSDATTPRDQGRDDPSALTIELSPELRQRIEVAATQRDMSMQQYIEDVLEQAVSRTSTASSQRGASEEERRLDPFRDVREAILQTTCGRLLDDSVEEIRRMREERTLHLESL
jgi:predicted transcriptional regulator